MQKFILFLLMTIFVTSCSSLGKGEASYPIDPEDRRRLKHGKITGEDGLSLFGGGQEEEQYAAGSGIAVNSFLWRATLETLSFMPLKSADPFGGVILTEWYENPETPGERFKASAFILDKKLRVDALDLTVYKQIRDKKTSQWRDAPINESLSRDLENKILSQARSMKIAQTRR